MLPAKQFWSETATRRNYHAALALALISRISQYFIYCPGQQITAWSPTRRNRMTKRPEAAREHIEAMNGLKLERTGISIPPCRMNTKPAAPGPLPYSAFRLALLLLGILLVALAKAVAAFRSRATNCAMAKRDSVCIRPAGTVSTHTIPIVPVMVNGYPAEQIRHAQINRMAVSQ